MAVQPSCKVQGAWPRWHEIQVEIGQVKGFGGAGLQGNSAMPVRN